MVAQSTGYSNSLFGRAQVTGGALDLDGQGNPVFDATPQPGSYAAMQSRIIDELRDAQTTAQVQFAIIQAIRDHEAERFWFNELLDDGSLSLVPGQELYSGDDWPPIATRPHIDYLSILAFGTRQRMTPRTATYIEEISTNPEWRAMPTDWCYVGGEVRVYPIPDMPYPLRIIGTQRFPEPSAPTDTSCWFVEAEAMIRCDAKRILYLHNLEDLERAQVMDAEVQRQLLRLRTETAQRTAGPMRVRPRLF